MNNIRFSLADVVGEISINPPSNEELWGFYEKYPADSTKASLSLSCEVIEHFAQNRVQSFNYPEFNVTTRGATISLSRKDVEGEMDISNKNQILGKFKVATSPHSLESAVRVGMSLALPYNGALMLHASAISTDEGAYIFAGVSGAGKSTISTLLGELPHIHKISDELLIVAKRNGAWRAYVTPFIGSKGLPHGRSDKIKAIYFLEQSTEHEAIPLQQSTAVKEILRHVVIYANHPDIAQNALDRSFELVSEIPSFRLRFSKDHSVSTVLGITCCSLSI